MSSTMNEQNDLRIPTPEELGFDPMALRAKYAAEREKRLRQDGNEQYVEVKHEYDRYEKDPYIDEPLVRDPIVEEIEVAIVGAGFGGMLAAARLQQAGVEDYRIIEKAGDFGGTWYWNRYPGAQCDIESYVYLPLLEETEYIPKEKYSYGPEIFAHAQRIGQRLRLYPKAYFQTQVGELTWHEDEGRWHITTDRDDLIKARFVVMSSGPLSRPKLPGLNGIENFKGHTFHTSRWDYDYTGGDSNGGLTKLGDKRVGIIGTGATGVQCTSHVAKDAGHLYVFQRTPSSIDERRNSNTDPSWVQTLEPGWQDKRNHNFACILSGVPQEEDLVADGWTDLFKDLGILLSEAGDSDVSADDIALLSEISDYKKMNGIRDRVNKVVSDEKTAEALKAWYRPWCKRPTFNDEFLPSFNQPNVTLVDTEGQGVDRITEKGVVVQGVEYELDCLIFATGFEVGTSYTRQGQFEVIGRDGVSLTDYWVDGMRTFHGFHAAGFPNCFHMGLTQTGLSPNLTYMLDNQARHVSYVINETNKRGAKAVEATPEAEADWVKTVLAPNMMTDYLAQCTPGYYNNEGKSGQGEGFFEGHYPEGAVQFFQMLDEWRDSGQLDGLRFS